MTLKNYFEEITNSINKKIHSGEERIKFSNRTEKKKFNKKLKNKQRFKHLLKLFFFEKTPTYNLNNTLQCRGGKNRSIINFCELLSYYHPNYSFNFKTFIECILELHYEQVTDSKIDELIHTVENTMNFSDSYHFHFLFYKIIFCPDISLVNVYSCYNYVFLEIKDTDIEDRNKIKKLIIKKIREKYLSFSLLLILENKLCKIEKLKLPKSVTIKQILLNV